MTVATPRQARSEQTLKRILAACDTLLAERTFEQISMQDIAREAGVSVGNLYNRFSDKEGLVNHVIAGHQQRLREVFVAELSAQPPDLDTRGRLRVIATVTRDAIKHLGPLFGTLAARMARGAEPGAEVSGNSQEAIDGITSWLLAGDASLDTDRCRFAIASMLFGLQYNLLFGSGERMFGDGYTEELSQQAYCYLTCEKN